MRPRGGAIITARKTFNRYVYCRNNPVNSTDPTGMAPGAMAMPSGERVNAAQGMMDQVREIIAQDEARHEQYMNDAFTGVLNKTSVTIAISEDSSKDASSGTDEGKGEEPQKPSQDPGGQFPEEEQQFTIFSVQQEVSNLLKNPVCAEVLGGLQNAQKLSNRAQVHYANTANPAYKGTGGRFPDAARLARAETLNPNSLVAAWSEEGQKGLPAANIYITERFFTNIGPSQQDTVYIHELNRLNGYTSKDYRSDYANIIKRCGTADPFGLIK